MIIVISTKTVTISLTCRVTAALPGPPPLATIAECELTNPATKEVTSFKELWQDQTCVIIFLRRFG